MTNIYDLKHELMEKRLKKHKTYEIIYDKIVSKIKFTNSNTNNCYCVYQFKKVEFGMPKYNVEECISYVSEKLRKNKFKIGLIDHDKILISWLHILEQQTKSERVIEKQVSLMDLKEREILNKQNQQMNQLQNLDNKFIQQSSHFGDTLQQFPLYNISQPVFNTNNRTQLPAIDYTAYNNNANNNNNNYSNNNNGSSNNIRSVGYNSNQSQRVKNKTPQQMKSSLELDNLLSQFDNAL